MAIKAGPVTRASAPRSERIRFASSRLAIVCPPKNTTPVRRSNGTALVVLLALDAAAAWALLAASALRARLMGACLEEVEKDAELALFRLSELSLCLSVPNGVGSSGAWRFRNEARADKYDSKSPK